METDNESLGARLARLRKAKGLSQEQLRKLAGVGQSTIASIENGSRTKVPGSLIDIAHALGVDAYYLKYGVTTMIAGDKIINEVVELLKKTEKEGKAVVLDKAKDMNQQYPLMARETTSFQ